MVKPFKPFVREKQYHLYGYVLSENSSVLDIIKGGSLPYPAFPLPKYVSNVVFSIENRHISV
jgi:hypothetical protein